MSNIFMSIRSLGEEGELFGNRVNEISIEGVHAALVTRVVCTALITTAVRAALITAAVLNQEEDVAFLLTKEEWFGGKIDKAIILAISAAIKFGHSDMAKLLLRVDIKRVLYEPHELLRLAAKNMAEKK
jgi:hypothetical protein